MCTCGHSGHVFGVLTGKGLRSTNLAHMSYLYQLPLGKHFNVSDVYFSYLYFIVIMPPLQAVHSLQHSGDIMFLPCPVVRVSIPLFVLMFFLMSVTCQYQLIRRGGAALAPSTMAIGQHTVHTD